MIENIELEPKVPYRGKLSFNEFAARIQVAMRREHRELRHPEGDVAPRVYLYCAERLFEKQIEPEWFNSRGTKDHLTEQIVKMIELMPLVEGLTFGQARGVNYVGLVYGMYRSWTDPTKLTAEERAAVERSEIPEGVPMPSEDPNREEVLGLLAFDREIAKAWHAVIHRSAKKSPRLGQWEDLDVGGWGLPGGLMVDPIREALR